MRVRCFVAVDIPLDEEALGRYRAIVAALQSTGARLKPVEPHNLHITLKFLGEVEEQRVERTRAALREVEYKPFKIALRGLGAFPSIARPRVVWVGVTEGSEELRSLRNLVEKALSGLFPGEAREFAAHLTLARVKFRAPGLTSQLAQLQDEELGEVYIGEFKLKRSKLTPQGPIYSDIEVFPLGGLRRGTSGS